MRGGFESVEEQGLVGIEARALDGSEVGRISEVVTDERTGEVTHVVVEMDEDRRMEIPITDLSLDPEADFATFRADPSDEEPGDHLGDIEEPQSYAPLRTDVEDKRHEGQLVGEPESAEEAQAEEDLVREDWEDETYTPTDSGYPRNDAYIDADTGQERERYPAEGEDLRSDVEQLLDGTDLRVREVREGVVVLEGSIATREDLQEILADITEIDGVLDVDTTDLDIGS
jgi:sporulation protein YlmC with PRC-barrel domain